MKVHVIRESIGEVVYHGRTLEEVICLGGGVGWKGKDEERFSSSTSIGGERVI